MQFKVIDNDKRTPSEGKDIAYLWTDNWNDWFKYQTLYVLTYFDSEGTKHEFGGVKIGQFKMEKGQSRPALPASFKKLSKQFFSLGQDVSYYSKISKLAPDAANELLTALRDLVIDTDLLLEAMKEDVTGESLLRSVSVRSIGGQFKRVLAGDAELTSYSFRYEGPAPLSGGDKLNLTFHVEPESTPPTNIHVLIGRNGVGKTYLLNRMTRALVLQEPDAEEEGQFVTEDVFDISTREGPFANIVSVSFSAFDDFALLPERRNAVKGVRYSSVGLRKRTKDKQDKIITITRDPSELGEEFVNSAKQCSAVERWNRWQRALTTLQTDDIFQEAHVADLANYRDDEDFAKEARKLWKSLSSGHKIVLLSITKLVEKVEERSLVLMDEPEAHLHPPLLAAFVRALSDLLIHRNGVAIIATHSPVVLQEVPASCVYKIVRHGSAVRADRPEVETFAENVGVLTRESFGLEVTRSGFHKMLSDAIGDLDAMDQVLNKFDNEVGSEGRALVSGLLATKKSDGT